ncbi:MAG: mechanosensitive ion channel [Rhodoferax sp.]|jgi:small-conductance mechanosensitive channel|nr:mechanosensitive ion channel [Rhodoferax sp.]
MTAGSHRPVPQPIDDFVGWLKALVQPTVALELATLAVCVLLAWGLVRAARQALGREERSIWFGRKDVDGVLFPLLLLCLGFGARALLDQYVNVVVLQLAIPVLLALVAIRTGVKVLQIAFSEARWVRALENTISWLVWLALVLWVSGLLPVLLSALDQVSWKVGTTRLSVRNILEGLLTASVVLILALWLSAGIEARLLRSATGGELSLRKALSNATRALLLTLGLMVALSAVGIDLTALSVVGGALGVGIGFGLQKVAANYVSGFVILTERNLRIGDFIKVESFEGAITQINARYTVVRAQTGRESIVPNEMLVSSRVENLSLADSVVVQTTQVQVAFNSDPAKVMELLQSAALAQERVLKDPGPSVQLSQFVADGLEFTLVYWINDLHNGQGNLRSDVNMAILSSLRDHGIQMNAPARVTPPVNNGTGSLGV